jgi:hypothetical protein
MRNVSIAGAVLALVPALASAGVFQVEIAGEVEFNGVNSGPIGAANPGDAMVISFLLDSDQFVDSNNFPTRGYEIDSDSFQIALGASTIGMANPYPAGQTPLFILRDNDPAVDGFFLGTNVDGFPNGVSTDQPGGIAPFFTALFSVTYGNDPLPSLDIADAVGSYDFTGLTVFNMGFEDGPFQPFGALFEQMTISEVPAPGAGLLLAGAPLFALRRRRA